MHIFLLGFMGSGKTSVGQALARRFSIPFYDTDEMIIQAAGKSIVQIFSEDGETAFRDLETQVLQALATQPRGVVATGGGALQRKENQLLIRKGLAILLAASPATILQRLKNERRTRPLLKAADWPQSLKTLYAERKVLYDAIPNKVKTDGKTVAAIVAEMTPLVSRYIDKESPA